ncbi:hypothetical protein QAD02_014754 [Eretmocerus hayati]|uniref:Uncharacterized protein n=1 Tax=Eretmocerus hayati TaxID=131215 RepID=A0ACC2P6M4_9HYME|nr:hypothetical protein QAD02_014754 [Eretmocerus hayati]
MPSYEMPLLLKTMAKPELFNALKRTAETIFEKGGFLRKIDNLGKQATPFKMSEWGQTHKEANYFIIYFDTAPKTLIELNAAYKRDADIVRHQIFAANNLEKVQCTFHEEMLPPPFRPDVQKLVEMGAREKRYQDKVDKKFKYNSGLDYYPFQK